MKQYPVKRHCTIVTPSLNAFHGYASTYMDLLVEEAKEDVGRK
jgi:hypothetical protein